MRNFWTLAILLVLTLTGESRAQDLASLTRAYKLGAEGLRAYSRGQNEEAYDKLSRAYSITKLPSLALNMARAEVKLGRYIDAARLYSEAATLDDGVGKHEVQERARQSAQSERELLAPRIPRVVVQTEGVPLQAVSVQMDGIAVPTPVSPDGSMVDPGKHTIVALSGDQRVEKTETFNDGETRSLLFVFATVTPPLTVPDKTPNRNRFETPAPDNGMHRAAWVSLGIGGTALAFSGTTAIWAWTKGHELSQSGPWDVNHCAAGNPGSDCREYRTLRTLSTIGFYTGLVGTATGLVLFLIPAPPVVGQSRATFAPYIGLGNVGFAGEF